MPRILNIVGFHTIFKCGSVEFVGSVRGSEFDCLVSSCENLQTKTYKNIINFIKK